MQVTRGGVPYVAYFYKELIFMEILSFQREKEKSW